MPEKQNIEWKLTWRDEYLKWICGFANAQGGRIYIGKDDTGKVVGLKDYEKLLEDIPNKVQITLGIMVDVNLLELYNQYYIEINVAPSSMPVNYKGEYHYRSGSTKQVLKGAALNDFLLQKNGTRWDDAPAPMFSSSDLDAESFNIFRREAMRSGRMSEEDLNISNEDILIRLGLSNNGIINRAGVLLFHRYPERLARGCYVKIGMFTNECDLVYQDEIRGSLFNIADKAIDVLYLKYLRAYISYDKETRIERYPYPRAAVREILFNALIHSKWSDGIPVQIRVDENSMSISNCCVLPLGWSTQTLVEKHKSKPYNPNIAEVFFRAGLVETWGRGIAKVQQVCRLQGYPEPEFNILGEDLTVTFSASLGQGRQNSTMAKPDGDLTKQNSTMAKPDGDLAKQNSTMAKPDGDLTKQRLSNEQKNLLEANIAQLCSERWVNRNEIAMKTGINSRTLRRILAQMVKDSRLKLLYPDNVKHPQQAYSLITYSEVR